MRKQIWKSCISIALVAALILCCCPLTLPVSAENTFDGLTNLALNKEVTGPQEGGWETNRLVDGITAGDTNTWNLGWGITQSAPIAENNVTLVINLGAVVGLDTFRIFPRDAFFGEVQNFPSSYTIAVSDDNASWKTVYETTSGVIPADVHTPAVVALNEVVKGQYVQITFRDINKQEDSSKWSIQLNELEIYNTHEGETEGDEVNPTVNIALNKEVTAPCKDSGWSPDRLVDGDLSGGTDDWNLGWGVSQDVPFAEKPVDVIINLGESKEFTTFKIYPRDAFFSEVQNFPNAYTIFVSDDNSNWEKVYETTDGPIPADVHVPAEVVLDKAAKAQYVKFTITGINKQESSNWTIELNELEIYNIPVESEEEIDPTVNLALKQGVTGPADGGWEIDRLVNGVLTGEPGWGITQDKSLAESPVVVTIDLGAAKDFTTIRMYPRDFFASEVRNFPSAYIIEVSSDNSHWEKVYETTEGPVPENVNTPVDVTLSKTAHAQYVRMTISGVNVDEYSDKGVIQVNELEIYNIPIIEEEPVDPTVNLALKQEVTGPNDSGWEISGLVNGVIEGEPGWGITQSTSFAESPVVAVINLGEAKDFTTIRMYPRNFWASEVRNFPGSYKIEVSTDNTTWETVYETTNGPVPSDVHSYVDITLSSVAKGQYVRLTITGANVDEYSDKWVIQMSELEIYNIPIENTEPEVDAAVENVKALIDAIGTVTLESESAINAAREAYDALSDAQKAQVNNYDVLTAAEAKLAELKAEEEDPHGNIALNKDITGPCTDGGWSTDRLVDGDITGDTTDWNLGWGMAQNASFTDSPVTLVIDLGKAYNFNTVMIYPRDAFFSRVQNFPNAYTISVSNDNASWDVIYDTNDGVIPADVHTPAVVELDATANGRYVKITFRGINKQENADKWEINLNELEIYNLDRDEAVVAVRKQINAIGTVTLDSEAAIKAAREAYDALNEEQKAQVSNYDVLVAAEEALAQLKQNAVDVEESAKVTAMIDAIGTVTLDSEAAIVAAREAYNALSNAAKDMVTNYDKLLAAEEALVKLREESFAKEGNLAFGATVNGPAESGWGTGRLVDGITAGDTNTWNLGWGVTQVESFDDAPVTLIIDLGSIESFTSFHLYPRDAFFSEVQNFPTAYTISVRGESGEWEIIYETENGIVPADVHTPAVINLDKTATGQYIMISISGINKQESSDKWAVQVAELEIYNTPIEGEEPGTEVDEAVENVKALINAIGTVTLESESAIKDAREAYDTLNAEQKALVENYQDLVNAEIALEALKNAGIPETGDHTVVSLAIGLMFMSAIGMAVSVTLRKKSI